MDPETNGVGNDHQADHPAHDDRAARDAAYEEQLIAPAGWKTTAARAAGVAVFLGMAVFWMYAFANRDSVPHLDEFDDPAYVETAEAVCANRQAEIAALPLATGATDPVERAGLIDLGTEQLELMVSELAEIGLPADPKGQDGVTQWLSDYEIYLDDRRRYSAVLATGEDPPFTLSANGNGTRVTDALRTYAEVNLMDSCAPSGDV